MKEDKEFDTFIVGIVIAIFVSSLLLSFFAVL